MGFKPYGKMLMLFGGLMLSTIIRKPGKVTAHYIYFCKYIIVFLQNISCLDIYTYIHGIFLTSRHVLIFMDYYVHVRLLHRLIELLQYQIYQSLISPVLVTGWSIASLIRLILVSLPQQTLQCNKQARESCVSVMFIIAEIWVFLIFRRRINLS